MQGNNIELGTNYNLNEALENLSPAYEPTEPVARTGAEDPTTPSSYTSDVSGHEPTGGVQDIASTGENDGGSIERKWSGPGFDVNTQGADSTALDILKRKIHGEPIDD
ncbi:TPA: hypothetical protein GX533_02655 [Candidatus Dojkabacteria bacterium]|jgi:hypothetical protein|uniref:Uncharacterized protein n=1 Tax=Candidatus Dojkabacteria bacterium TaxID=2099670 RepID=A0A832QCG5_9BACT|nr:hypothetical protein [Candidatus Dojkabacteria bacterium]